MHLTGLMAHQPICDNSTNAKGTITDRGTEGQKVGEINPVGSSKAGGYRLPFFFSLSSPKHCMYVLYQQAIIWVLPVYSTIEKKWRIR
jgi:hypothetical protein